MFRHIVCFRLKDSEKGRVYEAKSKLLSLKSISEVKNIEVGIDEKKSDRSYEIALIVDFENKDDCEIYDKHELHEPVKIFMHSICETTVAVDYYRDNK